MSVAAAVTQSVNRSALRDVRRQRERNGRWAELVAAGLLLAKGYRILERRCRGPLGEIDLVAVRGRRIAFVEVKLRRDLDTAIRSVSPRQAGRLRAAAERWVWRHPRYRSHSIGFDMVMLAPGQWPRHAIDALQR